VGKDTGSEFVIATIHPAVAALLDRFHAHPYLTASLATRPRQEQSPAR
jgi:hypothetical protein